MSVHFYEFQQFLKQNGTRQEQSALFHPATNGHVEQYVQDKANNKSNKF